MTGADATPDRAAIDGRELDIDRILVAIEFAPAAHRSLAKQAMRRLFPKRGTRS